MEEKAEVKHEFHRGEILAMSGGTYEQSRITANVVGELRNRLKGSPCFVLESNMRVRIPREDRGVYPDATVVCGKPQFDPEDPKRTTILNPRVVVEVLSESTESYDRGDKFTAYRELPSLEEYVLVSQNRPQIEAFLRQPEGLWLFATWQGLDAVAKLRCLQIDLPLTEVYEGLSFATAD